MCSTSALHRLRRLLRGSGRDMPEAIPGRSRETCASVRDRSHHHAGHHISAAACAGRGEAGAHRLRTVSLRLGSLVLRQPVSRLCDIAFLRASSCGVCARSWRRRLAAARARWAGVGRDLRAFRCGERVPDAHQSAGARRGYGTPATPSRSSESPSVKALHSELQPSTNKRFF